MIPPAHFGPSVIHIENLWMILVQKRCNMPICLQRIGSRRKEMGMLKGSLLTLTSWSYRLKVLAYFSFIEVKHAYLCAKRCVEWSVRGRSHRRIFCFSLVVAANVELLIFDKSKLSCFHGFIIYFFLTSITIKKLPATRNFQNGLSLSGNFYIIKTNAVNFHQFFKGVS